jgi:hypothetical protein
MAFSQDGIDGVIVLADGPELLIRWRSTALAPTIFQVYVDHRLSWSGTSRGCRVPLPLGADCRNVWVDVGIVTPGEAYIDFSSTLPGPSQRGDSVRISWTGGTYLDTTGSDDLLGFRIYRSKSPGGVVDRSRPVDTVPAYPGGRIVDGFGLGGFGAGGFGRAATNYLWTSTSLPSGIWQFAVVPYDKAGFDRGSGLSFTVNVTTAPRPPAADSSGRRLNYSYSGPITRMVTLTWLASPS